MYISVWKTTLFGNNKSKKNQHQSTNESKAKSKSKEHEHNHANECFRTWEMQNKTMTAREQWQKENARRSGQSKPGKDSIFISKSDNRGEARIGLVIKRHTRMSSVTASFCYVLCASYSIFVWNKNRDRTRMALVWDCDWLTRDRHRAIINVKQCER